MTSSITPLWNQMTKNRFNLVFFVAFFFLALTGYSQTAKKISAAKNMQSLTVASNNNLDHRPEKTTVTNQTALEVLKNKVEDVSKRDAYSKHYRNADGSYTALIGSGQLHYAKGGSFYDIDYNIKNNFSADYTLANKENLIESYFGSTSEKGVKSISKEGEIKEFLNTKMYWEVNGNKVGIVSSNNVNVTATGDKAYYHNLFNNISAEFTIQTGKRKLNYILPNAGTLAGAPSNAEYLVFQESVQLPLGWSFRKDAMRGIVIKDQNGKDVYEYENPTTNDVTDMGLFNNNTTMTVTQSGDMLVLLTKVKMNWLKDVARVFPIYVDPTTTYTPVNADYWTAQMNSAGGGSAISPAAGKNGTTWFRGFIKFNMASIPASTVTSSQVTLTVGNKAGTVSTTNPLGLSQSKYDLPEWAANYTQMYNYVTNASNTAGDYVSISSVPAIGASSTYTLPNQANLDIAAKTGSVNSFFCMTMRQGWTSTASQTIYAVYRDHTAGTLAPKLIVNYTPNDTYCHPNYIYANCAALGDCRYVGISNVTLGTINSNTTNTNIPMGYNSYVSDASRTTNLNIGTSYILSTKYLDSGSPVNGAIIGAWMDWNADGDFDDANEFLGNYNVATNNAVNNINFTVPSDATPGATRLRVRSILNDQTLGASDACATKEYGETEDYKVTLLAVLNPSLTVSNAGTGASYANGSHTFSLNASVNATAGTNPGFISTGWTGTGSVPATGTADNVTFSIAQNSSITWNWISATITSMPTFHNVGGAEQLAFNNSRLSYDSPTFRLSHTLNAADKYQIQVSTDPAFIGGSSWTQDFNGTFATATEANFNFTNTASQLTNGTTYYVRARTSGDNGSIWSAWTTTPPYSFTYDNTAVTPNWFQTTQTQLATATHSGTVANANHDITVAANGANVITNGSFEGNITGWTKSSSFAAAYQSGSSNFWSSDGSYSLEMWNNTPGSTGYFSGDYISMYQTANLSGVSNLLMDASYEGVSSIIVQLRVYVAETTQAAGTTGTLVHTWTPPSNAAISNINIDLSSYNFTGNKVIKLVYYVTGQETTTNMRYLNVDNVRGFAAPQGSATSTPITLTSVQNVEKYKDLVWTQTLNGGTVNLKIQQYNGSTWTDVAGYTNISATGDGLKSFDLTAMTAYSQIRLVAALSGSATVAVNDWSITFENPCDAEIVSVTDGSGCATAILQATASATTTQYLWYDAATGGNLLDTTTSGSWTTPVLTANTTTFYVAASNGTCESARTAVVATLTPTSAAILSTQGAAICTTESVTLYAETIDDALYTVNWYDAPTGGQLVHTGFTYTLTPTTSATYYAAAAEGTCESAREAVEIVLASKIWNGSADTVWNNAANWTPNGVPTLTNCVVIPVTANAPVIDANYNALAKTLTLEANAVLLVKTGSSIKVVNEVTVGNSADFTLENDAYLVQTQNVASNVNTGSITVNRHSTPMYRLEATGWSSPVENQNIYGFALGTVAGRVYEYDEAANAFSSTNITTASTFVPGKGYSVRSPNTYPNYTDLPTPNPVTFEGVFNGKPQNGNIGINITATNKGYNYVGNPYPSPIDATTFLDLNQNIESLYFWTHEAPPINGVYAANNYAAYSNAGGTQAAAGGASPDGIIQVGQGFIAKTIQAYLLEFTNDMRLTSSNGQFFKNQTEERHRMWLNLSDETTPYNQILIGYVPNATMAADHQIDAKLFGYSGSSIYTLIDETKYVIQGRSLPFQSTDIVPLGFKAATTGMYNISINNVDGIFSEGQTIYLKDKDATVTHNLTESNYVFSSQAGTFNDRFEIVYTNVLGTDENATQANNWFAYQKDNTITIKSKGFNIESVEIFDLTGRLLLSKDKVNATEFKCPANFADQMLLVKINKTLSKKVL